MCLILQSKVSIFISFGFREVGVIVQNLDITSGEVTVNLNEELLSKKKTSSDAFSQTGSNAVSVASTNPQKKQSALVGITKHASMFPEKVSQLLHAIWMGLLCAQSVFVLLFPFSCFFNSLNFELVMVMVIEIVKHYNHTYKILSAPNSTRTWICLYNNEN